MTAAKTSFRHSALILALWLTLVVVSLFGRSYIPIDETRYVTVAWNMWLHGDYLVPHLNGEAYSHKPPLLFWLMNAGWKVFGVNDWWPRLVPSFFALGALLLTQRIARQLWPQRPQVALYSGLILTGNMLWMIFMTATMFDMLVAFFTVLGMFGILQAWQRRTYTGWLILGLALGLGLLAKGPAILLQTLPLAVLAPWWIRASMSDSKPDWRWWYAGLAVAFVLGAAIVLAWAIPAGLHGGAKYQHEIFWGQTAGRMAQSFAHRHSYWWYLAMLPAIVTPWLFALPVWKGLAKVPALMHESALRFCLAWLVPVFIAFSLISGKQAQYLLPILPAFALLAARGLDEVKSTTWPDRALMLLTGVAAGAVLLLLPLYARHHALAHWFQTIPVWGGLLLILGAVVLFIRPEPRVGRYVLNVALLSAFAVSMVYLAVIRNAGPAYDIGEISRQIKALQMQNLPLASTGRYYGQYDFLGRLTASPESVYEVQLPAWFAAHPNGRAIVYFDKHVDLTTAKVEYRQYYRGNQVAILTAQQWQALQGKPQAKDMTSDDPPDD